MKPQTKPYVFFDQNVMEKISKKRYTLFQRNIESFISEKGIGIKQRLTPFGLLEFVGLNKKELFDIKHKGQNLNEYPFKSYQEVKDFMPCLKKKIQSKINKEFLNEKLEHKRQRDFFHFSPYGLKSINKYIEEIDSIYEELVDSFFLDRYSQTNISNLSVKDKDLFIHSLTKDVMAIVCQGQFIGSFRLICKLMIAHKNTPVQKGMFKRGSPYFDTMQEVIEICEKLKSKGDLVDCELVHLAVFGTDNRYCHCYTTDSKEDIKERLDLYCKAIHFFIWLFFDYTVQKNMPASNISKEYKRPEWRYGKVFILDKETGRKITKISTQKIYKNIKNQSTL